MCGGEYIIRPDITLYEEGLPNLEWSNALIHAGAADLLIIVGTSLTVSPANNIPYYANKSKTVIINKEPTWLDKDAGLVFHEDICEVFERIEIPE